MPETVIARRPEVSVVICTHNRSDGLRSVLADLARQEGIDALAWELLVVDNNSSDATRQVVDAGIAEGKLPLRYVFEPAQGKSRAMNRGIAESAGEIVVFTDDDVDIPPVWLAAILEPFADPECWGAGGPVEPVWEVPMPAWASESPPYRMMGAIVQYRNDLDAGAALAPPIGANCAYRREAFRRHGTFRVDLGHSGTSPIPGEDIEFGRRLMHHGRSIRYAPRALIRHPVTSTRLRRDYFERWYFNRGRLEAVLAPYELAPDTPFVAGVPRYLFRQFSDCSLRWLTAADPRRRFYFKLRMLMAAGAIREFFRRRRSTATD